jgi:hypothetical protein
MVKTFEEFIKESHTLQIDLDKEMVTDVELFDNGDANYYFTSDKPHDNNSVTMQEFLNMVETTDDSIEWECDGGTQAFARKQDGSEIQVDAGGNGDFTHHLITVTVLQ